MSALGMHDVNESESNGGLIIAKYGKRILFMQVLFLPQLPQVLAALIA